MFETKLAPPKAEYFCSILADARNDDPAPSDLMDWLPEPRRDRCECGGDMPGKCPGPRNCPMCQEDADDDR